MFKLAHVFFGIFLTCTGFELSLVKVSVVKCEGKAKKEPGSF